MKPRLLRLLVLLGSALLLGSCASIESEAPPAAGAGLKGLSRFFVLSNQNDNNALDQRIVAALKARGLAAESGPLTMMPDDTQAIVSYQDRWNWDFGERLVYLRLAVRHPDSNETLASATFSARIPLTESTSETVGRLVTRLFNNAPPAAPAAPKPDPAAAPKPRGR